MEIDKRRTLIEYVKEAADWMSQDIRVSIDERGEVHTILSVEMGDSAHYGLCARKPEDPVVEFVGGLVDNATSMSMTFKKPNVIDEIVLESRDDCLVIHNAKGAPYISICTLMEALQVDEGTATRAFKRIAKKQVKQICLTRPRDKWVLSQRA